MIDWKKTAFVFPGQGSQVVGMGQDLAQTYTSARATFEEADAELGFSLSELCFNGPQEILDDTLNTQPALYTCCIATMRALQEELPGGIAMFAAGHSLGELTALAAAGAFTFAEG